MGSYVISNDGLLLMRVPNANHVIYFMSSHLNAILEDDKFMPNLIIFNAGTDILQGLGSTFGGGDGYNKMNLYFFIWNFKNPALDDPLGKLAISPSVSLHDG